MSVESFKRIKRPVAREDVIVSVSLTVISGQQQQILRSVVAPGTMYGFRTSLVAIQGLPATQSTVLWVLGIHRKSPAGTKPIGLVAGDHLWEPHSDIVDRGVFFTGQDSNGSLTANISVDSISSSQRRMQTGDELFIKFGSPGFTTECQIYGVVTFFYKT